MSVGVDGEADVPAEAEEPGDASGDRGGTGGGSQPGEHREQWRHPTRPHHQLQQHRDNTATQGPQEVSMFNVTS